MFEEKDWFTRGYFLGSKSILYDTIVVDTRHCAFDKTHRTLYREECILNHAKFKKIIRKLRTSYWNRDYDKRI